MGLSLVEFKYRKICKLDVKEGDTKQKVWDSNLKKVVQTNEIKHWKLQTFGLYLGKHGKEELGYIKVEYWGDRDLKDGWYFTKATFYLKEKTWKTKDPKTFVEKKLSQVILVLKDFDEMVETNPMDKRNHFRSKVLKNTPEENIALGIQEYGKPVDMTEKKEGEQLVDINEEFEKMEL